MIKRIGMFALVAIGIGALFLATPAFALNPHPAGCSGNPHGQVDNPTSGNPHDVTGTHPGDAGNPHDVAGVPNHDACPGSNVH